MLLGGAIILNAPYHHMGYIAYEGDVYAFEIWGGAGYYPELEVSLQANAGNSTTIRVDMRFVNNDTLDVYILNVTLNDADRLLEVESITYEERNLVHLPFGNYTFYVDRLDGFPRIDIAYTQTSDSRTYIVLGGSMNIIGLIMGAAGYFVGGTLISSGDEALYDWGYDDQVR